MAKIRPFQSFPPIYDWWCAFSHWEYELDGVWQPVHLYIYGGFWDMPLGVSADLSLPDEDTARQACAITYQFHDAWDPACVYCICFDYTTHLPRFNIQRGPRRFRNSCGYPTPPEHYPLAIHLGRIYEGYIPPWPYPDQPAS